MTLRTRHPLLVAGSGCRVAVEDGFPMGPWVYSGPVNYRVAPEEWLGEPETPDFVGVNPVDLGTGESWTLGNTEVMIISMA